MLFIKINEMGCTLPIYDRYRVTHHENRFRREEPLNHHFQYTKKQYIIHRHISIEDRTKALLSRCICRCAGEQQETLGEGEESR
jgi:hypothetical protein